LTARSPVSAEPLAATTSSEETSYFALVSSGSSMIRCIITGTTTSESQRWRATSARHDSGSNLRRRT
jgi:hypothetical protein